MGRYGSDRTSAFRTVLRMTGSQVFKTSWPPMITTAIAGTAILVASGMQLVDVVKIAIYVLVFIAFPGVFVWRAMLAHLHRPNVGPTWLEDLSLGTIFGFGLQLPVYIVGVLIGHARIVMLIPVVVALLLVTRRGRRVWTLPTGRFGWRGSWVLAGVFLYGLVFLARRVFVIRPMSIPLDHTPSVDETFHQALIAELAHRFPPQSPYLLGTPLDYHWFVHAQMAATRWVTGVDSVAMIRQLFPALLLLLTVLGLAAVALRLTRHRVGALLAPALLVAGGFTMLGVNYPRGTFVEPFMSRRYIQSPSQSYGEMVALPAIFLILEVLRPRRKPRLVTWIALILSLLALSGAKATFMPIFLFGSIVLWVVRLVMKRRVDLTASLLVVIVFAVSLFAQFVLFGAQTGGLMWMPLGTARHAVLQMGMEVTPVTVILMSLTLLVAWVLYGVGAIGLVLRGRWRDPRALWLLFAVPSAIGVGLFLFRSGLSQLWFSRSAAELIVIVSAWGVVVLLPRPLRAAQGWRLVAWATASGLAAYLIADLVSLQHDKGETHLDALVLTVATPLIIVALFLIVRLLADAFGRWRKPGAIYLVAILLGLGLTNVFATFQVVANPTELVANSAAMFAPGGLEAADYVRKHSSPDEVVATNVHCVHPKTKACDNRSFWVSAYTERRVLIEGWGYTAVNRAQGDNAGTAHKPTPYPERLAINDAAFQYPSEETVGRLVDTYGVDWLFVNKKYPADVPGLTALTGLLKKKFHNDHYVVYRVIK